MSLGRSRKTPKSKGSSQIEPAKRRGYSWSAAHRRWLAETQKRTKAKDEAILRWFDQHLRGADVQSITRDVIAELRARKAAETSQATADRYMALLRAILVKCVTEWDVLSAAPKVPMYRPRVAEPRFLNRAEFERLAQVMPEHLRLRAWFAVLTGLPMRSMLSLKWSRIDLKARRAWIPAEQTQAARRHDIPLSTAAVAVLKELRSLSPGSEHVFTWRGKPVDDCNGKAFKDAVRRAGLEPLRWTDLRHTWACWAVQGGVTLQELKQLGGWNNYQLVVRYAHFAPDRLANAADKVLAGHQGSGVPAFGTANRSTRAAARR